MLQSIRDKSQGLIVGFIVFLISLTFALFGIQSYFTGQDDVTVAEVDSQKIKLTALLERIKKLRQQTEEELGIQPNPEIWSSDLIKSQTLNLMIDEVVLNQVINESGIRVSDESIVSRIKDIDAFYDESGFSRQRYESLLTRTGTTTKEFEETIVSDFLRSHVKLGVLGSEFSTVAETNTLFEIRNQTRDISVALVKVFSRNNNVVLDDEELKEYFLENRESYKTEEKVSVEFLKLSRETIKNTLPKISEENAKEKYESSQYQFTTPETRDIEYLLISNDQSIDEALRSQTLEIILTQISEGKTFFEIKKMIDKKIEVELDSVDNLNKGDLPSDLETAVFSLDEGEVSEPLATQFGTQIIKLKSIKPATVLPFEKVKERIVEEDLENRVEQTFVEKAESMAELAFESPDSLEEVALSLALEPKTTGFLSRDQISNQFGNSAVLKIFNDDVLVNRYNSELVDIKSDSLAVFRVSEHLPSTIPAFNEVLDQVKGELLALKLKRDTENFASKIVKELVESGGQSQEFRDAGLRWISNKNINRFSEAIPSNLVDKAFEIQILNNNPQYFYIDYDENTIAIAKVQNPQMTSIVDNNEEEINKVRDFIVRPRSAVMWNDYLNILRSDKKVVIYESNFNP